MTSPPNLSLTFEGRLADTFPVVSFRGAEVVNRLYRLAVDFTYDGADDLLEETLLRRPATLSLMSGAEAIRSFHGIAASITAHGVHLYDRRAYRMTLAPRMWLLKHRKTRRIWSNVTSLEIALDLFREPGILLRSRLFSEDGIFFTFDHPPSRAAVTS